MVSYKNFAIVKTVRIRLLTKNSFAVKGRPTNRALVFCEKALKNFAVLLKKRQFW